MSQSPWDDDQLTSVGEEAYDLFGPEGFGPPGSGVKEGNSSQYENRSRSVVGPSPTISMSFGGGAESLDHHESFVDSGNSDESVRVPGQRSWSIGSIPNNQFLGGMTSGDQLFREYMQTMRSDGSSTFTVSDQGAIAMGEASTGGQGVSGTGEAAPSSGRGGTRRTRGSSGVGDSREGSVFKGGGGALPLGVGDSRVHQAPPLPPQPHMMGFDYTSSMIGFRGGGGAVGMNAGGMPPQMMALAKGMHPNSGMSMAQVASMGMAPQSAAGMMGGGAWSAAQRGSGARQTRGSALSSSSSSSSAAASSSSSSTSSRSSNGAAGASAAAGVGMDVGGDEKLGDNSYMNAVGDDIGDLSDDASMFYDSGPEMRLEGAGAGGWGAAGGMDTFGPGSSPKATTAKKARRGRSDDAGAAGMMGTAGMMGAASMMGAAPGGTSAGRGAAVGATRSSSSSIGGANISSEVKAKEKNREHAKNTRMRKKTYIESLKDEVRVLSEAREMTETAQRFALAQKAEQVNAHKAAVSTFLAYRTSNEQNRSLWAELLDEQFTLMLPITPYRSFPPSEVREGARVVRGIDAVIRDAASINVMIKSVGLPLNDGACVSAQYYSLNVETFSNSTRLMCPFYMCTENAVERGAKNEITKNGMLTARFRADEPSKLLSVEMTFDVMSFMQQLRRASASAEFRVVPNVYAVASEATQEVRLVVSAKDNTITHVTSRWSECFGYTPTEAQGKSVSMLFGADTDKAKMATMVEQIRALRPACGFANLYTRKGAKSCLWLQLYPIYTEGALSHYVYQMDAAIDSAPAPLPLERPKMVPGMPRGMPLHGVGSASSSSISSDNSRGSLPFGWPMSGLEIPPYLAKRMGRNPSPGGSLTGSIPGTAGASNFKTPAATGGAEITQSTSGGSLDQQSSSSADTSEKGMATSVANSSSSGNTDQEAMDVVESAANNASLSECIEGLFPSSAEDEVVPGSARNTHVGKVSDDTGDSD